MDTILLATDGSEYSHLAAERALEMAVEEAASLHVICVVDERRFNQPALSVAELPTIVAEDHAHDCITAVQNMAAETPVEVVGAVRYGRPHEAILEYASEVEAAVILLGEHGDHDFHDTGIGKQLRDGATQEVLVLGGVTP